jgi:hypothetical protein
MCKLTVFVSQKRGYLYSDKDLTLYHVIILIYYRKRKQVVLLEYSSRTDVEQDRAVLPSARSRKNSSTGHVTIRSHFLVGADVAVNNIKLFSAAMECNNAFALHCCSATRYFVLMLAVKC